MNDRFRDTPKSSDFKTAEGKILAFLVIINLIIWVIFAVLIGYTNIMIEQELPQQESIIVYDRS